MLNPRLLGKFRDVAAQRLARLGDAVMRLEATGANDPALLDAQRDLHTLKGEARIVGLANAASLTHQLEELLAAARPGGFKDRNAVSLLLQGLDLVGRFAQGATVDGEPNVDCAPWQAQVAPILDAFRASSAVVEEVKAAAPRPDATPAAGSALKADRETLDALLQVGADLRTSVRSRRDLIQGLAGVLASLPRDDRSGALRGTVRALLERERGAMFEMEGAVDRLASVVHGMTLLPLQDVFMPQARAARDLALELGKDVTVEVEGGALRLEKRVLDEVAELLLHLVRNAMDHGLETPEQRAAAGKPERGTLRLTAIPSGSMVDILVEDDGRGIQADDIRNAAVARKLVSGEAAATTDDAALLELLFSPGFSTRSAAGAVSGRGVGLDVVRAKAQLLGGTVEVKTQPGEGTSFLVRVPATLSTARMLLLDAGGGRMAIPSTAVEGVFRVPETAVFHEAAGDWLELEGTRHPVVALADALGLPNQEHTGDLVVVLVGHAGQRHAFTVDAVPGERELLVRAPGKFLAGLHTVRAAAVLDDGTLAVCLEPAALLLRAPSAGRARRAAGRAGKALVPVKRRVLVVDDSELTRDVTCSFLRDAGLEVDEAVDGQEALRRVQLNVPGMVITDLQMPVMDGFELIKALRAAPATALLPILVLSTLGAAADRALASRLGADAYLVKADLRRDTILAAVERLHVHAGQDGAAAPQVSV